MEFKSTLSTSNDPQQMIHQLTGRCGSDFDMGVLFITPHQESHIQIIVQGIQEKVKIQNFLACTCAGIIGSQAELENQTAASLFLAKLPKVKIKPFYIDQEHIENLFLDEDFYELFEIYPNENPVFMIFPDPFRVDLNRFILGMNNAYGASPVVGGLASGSASANGNLLMLNGQSYNHGIIGMVMTGDIKIDTIVSQGCKPIGESYIVTKAENNIIYEIAGEPFLDVLRKIFVKLSENERRLVQQALLIGIVMDEYKHGFNRGDFIVRSVIGVDQETGAVAIGDIINPGQTIQIHIRDAKTAEEDLNQLLAVYKEKNKASTPQGAFVFSCNGRGLSLFGEPDHDIKLIQKYIGPIPAAGFFCAGEIGPVGGRNFLHGFTDSIVVFS
ncbi:MAG: FIST N-terminal domain-containing protein [Candidatus Omnitrophota bacterium]